MSIGDQNRSLLGLEPFEVEDRLVPATTPVGLVHSFEFATGSVQTEHSAEIASSILDLLYSIDLRTTLPHSPQGSPGDSEEVVDAAAYDVKLHLLKAMPPAEQLAISQIGSSQTDIRDAIARTVIDLLAEREDEHHDELLRVHLLTTPTTTYQPTAPVADDAGYWDQRISLPTSLKRAVSELPGTPPDHSPTQSANSQNLIPWDLVTAAVSSAKNGGTPSNQSALEGATTNQRAFESTLAELLASTEILHVLPLAELSPVDFSDLGTATSAFLAHLDALGIDLDDPGSWSGYVWLAASIALAGRMAHRAIAVQSRPRVRLGFKVGSFETENTNEDHRS